MADGLNDEQGTRKADEGAGSTGAGSEAAEGIHGAQKDHSGEPRDIGEPSDWGQESSTTGPSGSGEQASRNASTGRRGEQGGSSGSEPLPESDQHRSRYGGGSRES